MIAIGTTFTDQFGTWTVVGPPRPVPYDSAGHSFDVQDVRDPDGRICFMAVEAIEHCTKPLAHPWGEPEEDATGHRGRNER